MVKMWFSKVRLITWMCCLMVLLIYTNSISNPPSGTIWTIGPDQSGKTISMDGDWSGTVVISACNVTFNIKCYKLNGVGQSAGITIQSSASNVTITGNNGYQACGTIRGYKVGIVSYGFYVFFDGLNVIGNDNGIEIRNSNVYTIGDCNVRGIKNFGLALLNSNNILMYWSYFQGCGLDGAIFNRSTSIEFRNCYFNSNNRHGIYFINVSNIAFTTGGNSSSNKGNGITIKDCPSQISIVPFIAYSNLGYGAHKTNSPYVLAENYHLTGNVLGPKNW